MRLIDVDAFDAIINDDGTIDEYATETARNAMLIMPTVDAVEVVRCKDCKYYQHKSLTDDEWNWCMQWHNYTDKNVFCSLAERKEE